MSEEAIHVLADGGRVVRRLVALEALMRSATWKVDPVSGDEYNVNASAARVSSWADELAGIRGECEAVATEAWAYKCATTECHGCECDECEAAVAALAARLAPEKP